MSTSAYRLAATLRALASLRARPFVPAVMHLKSLVAAATYPVTPAMPVLFVSHGSPMNALYDNAFPRRLRQLGTSTVEQAGRRIVKDALLGFVRKVVGPAFG